MRLDFNEIRFKLIAIKDRLMDRGGELLESAPSFSECAYVLARISGRMYRLWVRFFRSCSTRLRSCFRLVGSYFRFIGSLFQQIANSIRMPQLKSYRKPMLFTLVLLLLGAGAFFYPLKGEKKEMSMKMNTPHNVRGVVSYKRSFGDLNEVHLKVARTIGIAPIANRQQAESLKDKLRHIESNSLYAVDSLTHSIPYLVPGAARLLDVMGQNFLDSCANKGLNPNRIVVTSVLRTREDVKRLRRSNGNASENSAHYYGTTFDVSWRRFEKVEDEEGRPMQDVSADTLKLVLSEVLRDLKAANSCYVKYELKQGCFHITTRLKE